MKLEIIQGNTLDIMPKLPAESIDLCITSPPYWGLRAYGTEQQTFGGKAECEHEWEEIETTRPNQAGGQNTGIIELLQKQTAVDYSHRVSISNKCRLCGAWRGEYGNEPTMEAYLDNTMRWVHEVWRVLKPTGSFVLNIGDCFYGSWGGGYDRELKVKGNAETQPYGALGLKNPLRTSNFYKSKQLLSVSSFAYCRIVSETDFVCRGEHIWAKPNVPSPIRSRLKHSHEKLFWFVKDADRNYFDAKPWMKKCGSDLRKVNWANGQDYALNHPSRRLADTGKRNNDETIEHSWRIVPVGAKQSGFELNGKVASEHVAPFPENLIAPYIQSLCPHDGTVLDPFVGSGTTMRVAQENHRSAVGIDLNEKSIAYLKKRLNWGAGLGVDYLE